MEYSAKNPSQFQHQTTTAGSNGTNILRLMAILRAARSSSMNTNIGTETIGYSESQQSLREQSMSGQRVLVIEDDKDIVELLRYNLSREGYRVTCAMSGEEGLRAAATATPDLVLLDLMLPEMDGLQICRALKSDHRTKQIPVVMLTAKSEEVDIVTGLEMGADDYITKPFSPRVLIARLRAVFRRKEEADLGEAVELPINIRGISIDSGRHEVHIDNNHVDLTNSEFELLRIMADKPGWVFTRSQLMNKLRGDGTFVTDRTVDVHVAGLRKKMGAAGSNIETIRGVGYRFKE